MNTMFSLLKNSFKNFEKNFEKEILDKKELTNGLRNNVKNDFIRLYSLKNGDSIGFGLNNSKVIDNNLINEIMNVTYYENEYKKYSKIFQYEELRLILNNFNKEYNKTELEKNNFLKSKFKDFFDLKLGNENNNLDVIENFIKDNKDYLNKYIDIKNDLNKINIKYNENYTLYSKELNKIIEKLKEKYSITHLSNERIKIKEDLKKIRDTIYGEYFNKKEALIYKYYVENDLSNKIGYRYYFDTLSNNIEKLNTNIELDNSFEINF